MPPPENLPPVDSLNVLMISLGDEVITGWGDTRQRHIEYAERINHLHIVMYSPASRGLETTRITENLTAYPSGTRFRPLFPYEAFRIGARICRQHRIDVITTQDPFLTGLAGVWLKNRFGIPLDLQNHSDFFDNKYWITERPLRYGFLNWLGKRLLPGGDTHRVLNDVEKQKYVDMGIDPNRVVVLSTPVRLGRFTPGSLDAALRADLNIPVDAPLLLWVGKPGPVKRVNDLIRALKMVHQQQPDTHLIVVGDVKKHQPELFDLTTELGLTDQVHFAGLVSHEDLPRYYRTCNIYVHSSNYEGLGKVMIEAASCGKPVVSTRTSGAQAIVIDGETGLLANIEDPPDLAAKILALLDHPSRAAAMGTAARTYVTAKFDHADNLDAVIETWQQCVRFNR